MINKIFEFLIQSIILVILFYMGKEYHVVHDHSLQILLLVIIPILINSFSVFFSDLKHLPSSDLAYITLTHEKFIITDKNFLKCFTNIIRYCREPINQILLVQDDDIYVFYDKYNKDIKISSGAYTKLKRDTLEFLLLRTLIEKNLLTENDPASKEYKLRKTFYWIWYIYAVIVLVVGYVGIHTTSPIYQYLLFLIVSMFVAIGLIIIFKIKFYHSTFIQQVNKDLCNKYGPRQTKKHITSIKKLLNKNSKSYRWIKQMERECT